MKTLAIFLILLSCRFAVAKTYDFDKLYQSLAEASIEQNGSLQTYASKDDTYYLEINNYLRFYPKAYTWYGLGPQQAKKIVTDIDALFLRAKPLPADVTLFRGEGLGWHHNQSLSVGEEFVDAGYVSTSLMASIAGDFSFSDAGGEQNKAGRPALFVMYFSLASQRKAILIHSDEAEALLPHGTLFRVMDRRLADRQTDLYLLQICSASCERQVLPEAESFWQNFIK
jgi:hypothetical protein